MCSIKIQMILPSFWITTDSVSFFRSGAPTWAPSTLGKVFAHRKLTQHLICPTRSPDISLRYEHRRQLKLSCHLQHWYGIPHGQPVLFLAALLSVQLPVDTPEKTVDDDLSNWSLPPMGEARMGSLTPASSLTQPRSLQLFEESVDGKSLSISVSTCLFVTLSFKQNKSLYKNKKWTLFKTKLVPSHIQKYISKRLQFSCVSPVLYFCLFITFITINGTDFKSA